MSGENPIKKYVQKFIELTDEEAEEFCAAFKEINVKKKQFLIQPGFAVKNRFFQDTACCIHTGSDLWISHPATFQFGFKFQFLGKK
jgi:hypothetical protein